MSRRTQPYRRGARQPGVTLRAMLKGRGALGNPMDTRRGTARYARRRKGLRQALRARRY